jgi:hypothetical protein
MGKTLCLYRNWDNATMSGAYDALLGSSTAQFTLLC